MVPANIHVAHQSLLDDTREIFILHTNVYCRARIKFGVYKTRSNSDLALLSVIFHIVRQGDKIGSRHAEAVSTAAASVTDTTECVIQKFAPGDAHLGFALVHDFIMQSKWHEMCLQHLGVVP